MTHGQSCAIRSSRSPCSHPRQRQSTSSTSTLDTARSCSSRPSRYVGYHLHRKEGDLGGEVLQNAFLSDLFRILRCFSLSVMVEELQHFVHKLPSNMTTSIAACWIRRDHHRYHVLPALVDTEVDLFSVFLDHMASRAAKQPSHNAPNAAAFKLSTSLSFITRHHGFLYHLRHAW